MKLFCLTGVATLACALHLHATELTWDANTTTTGAQDGANVWNTITNTWWNGSANVIWNSATPDSAIFGANNAAGATVTVPASTTNTVGNISFSPPASGNYIIAAGSTTTSKLNLSGNPTITVSNGLNSAINVVLSGTTFTKAGGGTLTNNPGAPNLTSGTTYVTGGTLVIGGAANNRLIVPGDLIVTNGSTAVLGSVSNIASTCTLSLYQGSAFNTVSGASQTLGGVILDGNSAMTEAGSETLTVSGNFDARSGAVNSASGKMDAGTFTKSTSGTVTFQPKGSAASTGGLTNTILNAGTLVFDYTQNSSKLNDASGTLTVNGGTLIITNGTSHNEVFFSLTLTNGVITNATGAVTLSPTNFIDVRKGEIDAVLAGGGVLAKTTPDTVVLGAANTYSGGTLVSAGVLQVGNGGAAGALGSGPVTNNSAIIFNLGSGTATIGGAISGSGSVTQIGSGTAALTGANTYQGTTTISNGIISINGTSTLGDGTGAVNLSGGTLNTSATRSVSANPVPNAINLTASSAITTTSTSSTVDLNFTNNSINTTAGTLTLSNSAASGTGQFEPRFSGGGFTFSQPIVVANGNFGTTRLSSFNTNGTTQTFNGVISGSGGFRRSIGSGNGGVTIFNATNTYSGGTAINAGTLLVNGAIGSGSVTITSGGVLGGNGAVNGPVTVQSGGTLSAGNGIGILAISNSLTFQAGSTNLAELNKSTPTNDLVCGLTAVTYAGTLVVTNLSGTLALNDSFKIFDAASYTGSFSATNLPTLGAGLAWDTTGLATNGTIKVVSAVVSQPQIGTVSLSGTNIVLTGSGGTVGANYYVLTSTNLALPLTNWTFIATNQFITGGNFTLTNPVDPTAPSSFYILQVP